MANTNINPDFSPAAKRKIVTAVTRVLATPINAGWNPGPASAGRVLPLPVPQPQYQFQVFQATSQNQTGWSFVMAHSMT
jgi:hypothetical protein